MTTLEPPNPPAVDGRRARGERTRAAIITALIQLLEGGELKPTGAQIAARAGISIRALWANFSDLETLYDLTGRVLLSRADQYTVVIPTDLPLAERIDRFCAVRAAACERVAPFAKATRLREPYSAALRTNRRRTLDRLVAAIEQAFAPELAAAGERRADLLLSLTASTSWSWWSVLRDDYGLEVARCTAVLRETVTRLLGETGVTIRTS
ncbi:TetR/AcrR family transcriptional regulator [Pseudonocardia humida]|uniref:TetR/AcrR family transcriptional regulator n=1 Tax=Pseudonocardia humida TaxID=2800819 RepID=A0ABT0ZVP8_9PSEU|nr:TetR/AcrR family transcriptional regulator [Pseudonocardia humida]MCO1654812.1 TetR/AcrR family transcriptional regulator [Pseudonocardia humida]